MILHIFFYLKNGITIEDEVEFADDATTQDLVELKDFIKDNIKLAMKNNDTGSIIFGTTLIRFSEIAAVKFLQK